MKTPSIDTVAAGKLPSPPAIVLRIVQEVSRPDCVIPDLSDLITNDPGLSAELLRAVNSAFYRPKNKVTTVQRAIALLGLQAVRNLVLCIAAQGLFVPPAGFPINRFWEVSLRRAASAKLITHHLGIRKSDELFTLGLLQDAGILTATLIHPELAEEIITILDLPAQDRLEREHELGISHDVLGYQLLKKWDLDESFVLSLHDHHGPRDDRDDPCVPKRARILAAADAFADLILVDDKLAALAEIERHLDILGLDRAILSELVSDIDETAHASAEMLGMTHSEHLELSAIMASAAKGLVDITMGYQQMVGHLEASLKREQEMAQKLEEMNQRLKEESSTDPLTGLGNRRALDAELERTLAQAKRQGGAVSLLMIDADHFKRVNDTYGHAAGDEVLKSLAAATQRVLRRADLLARIGGEEFAVLLPFTNLAGAAVAAERIRAEIEELRIPWEDRELRVTASLGCAQIADLDDPHAGALALRRADEALYAAKEGGRNRVVQAT